MRRALIGLVTVSTILAVGGSLLAATPRGVPHRYNPNSLDGRLVQLTSSADGRDWAAWAYRSGAQYDIALVHTDESGTWTEPVFLGADDGRDQVEPALAADANGNVYVAYADRSSGQVLLSTLIAGTETWTTPVALSAAQLRAHSPVLRVVRDRLVVAYRTDRAIEMIDLPLAEIERISLNGMTDGGDPVEYRPPPGGGEGNPIDRWREKRTIGDEDENVEVTIPFGKKSSSSSQQ